jgi:16S rRNA (guanine527-N7)-methyltransferase
MSATGGAAAPAPAALEAAVAADRARALTLTAVSRETLRRLDDFVVTFRDWQSRMNLIAASTEAHLWTRHIADSLQLLALAPPQALTWVDLGSGGGFPGLMIACALADTPGVEVHLVESKKKKAAFLEEAVRITGAPAVVHAVRIEEFMKSAPKSVDVVTARALAPLAELLTAAYPLLKKGACGLFPKGQDVANELTEATKYWKVEAILATSRTDPNGRIVVVQAIEPKARPAAAGKDSAMLTRPRKNRQSNRQVIRQAQKGRLP